MGLLSKLRGSSTSKRALASRKPIHFPSDLEAPGVLAVLSGRRREDIWPALFLLNTLQKCFPEGKHVLVCRETDGELAGTLRQVPETLCYTDTPAAAMKPRTPLETR